MEIGFKKAEGTVSMVCFWLRYGVKNNGTSHENQLSCSLHQTSLSPLVLFSHQRAAFKRCHHFHRISKMVMLKSFTHFLKLHWMLLFMHCVVGGAIFVGKPPFLWCSNFTKTESLFSPCAKTSFQMPPWGTNIWLMGSSKSLWGLDPTVIPVFHR